MCCIAVEGSKNEVITPTAEQVYLGVDYKNDDVPTKCETATGLEKVIVQLQNLKIATNYGVF
jgi:hypothetical protein